MANINRSHPCGTTLTSINGRIIIKELILSVVLFALLFLVSCRNKDIDTAERYLHMNEPKKAIDILVGLNQSKLSHSDKFRTDSLLLVARQNYSKIFFLQLKPLLSSNKFIEIRSHNKNLDRYITQNSAYFDSIQYIFAKANHIVDSFIQIVDNYVADKKPMQAYGVMVNLDLLDSSSCNITADSAIKDKCNSLILVLHPHLITYFKQSHDFTLIEKYLATPIGQMDTSTKTFVENQRKIEANRKKYQEILMMVLNRAPLLKALVAGKSTVSNALQNQYYFETEPAVGGGEKAIWYYKTAPNLTNITISKTSNSIYNVHFEVGGRFDQAAEYVVDLSNGAVERRYDRFSRAFGF